MSFVSGYVLAGEAKLYKHQKAETLYLTIPSKIAQDSAFVFKKGDRVHIHYDPKKKAIIVQALEDKKTQEEKK